MENVVPTANRVLSTLSRHHEQINSLFAAIKPGASCRDALVRELFVELRVHSILEQQLLFPQLASIISREQVKASAKDFYLILALMLELEQVRSGTEQFEYALKMIAETFEKHAHQQETVLFKQLAEHQNQFDFGALDRRLEYRKSELCEKMRSRMTPKVFDETGFAGVQVARHSRCA